MLILAEYIWLDGGSPTQKPRSKTRVLDVADPKALTLDSFPEWSYDGSSTNQAEGGDSDLILRPVNFVKDPLRGENDVLVMCEVFDAEGRPHSTNLRSVLREVMDAGGDAEQPWIGFEQEYTLFQNGRPLGFPEGGYPAPQGPFYCGVGAQNAYGRDIVEAHTRACIDAGLMIYGINAEVMPGQWEFQIGYRGLEAESADPLNVSDHLWIGRWLLMRIAENYGVMPSFDPKPMRGDWNGAGNHTNFSTRAMREAGGIAEIDKAVERLAASHDLHIANYGEGLADRLTGLHETCSIHEFKNGIADRGASIRVPRPVAAKGYGYFEDRRPGANCDPYLVSALLLSTVCGIANERLGSTDRIRTAA